MAADAAHPVDVALRDGSTVRVRPVRASDRDGLRALLGGMSDDSRWLRFLSAAVNLDQAAEWAAEPGKGVGLVVTAGTPERIVAHATYACETHERAEVAFEVADEWHGRGIATILLAHLAGAAEHRGVATFVAYVHARNHRMIGVFRESGFPVRVHASMGELEVEMPASLSDAARRRFEDRGRDAAAAAVAHVLRPEAIAVIGASSSGGSVGTAVLRSLLDSGYRGRLHVVHPEAAAIEGVRAHPTIAELPGPIDLAVVTVPAPLLPDVARQCGAAGVRAMAVLSGGFADAGPDGRQRLAELLTICRASGMRLVGPNCLGVLNTHPEVRLNATYAPMAPARGRVALASQSGGIGVAAIAEATRRGLGISTFVSTGDKADLSGNDFLQYWEQDPDTDVVLLYLESFGNPRRFGTITRRITATKPIVAVKSGRRATAPGSPGTRTAALLGAADVTVDALFAHAGVIRTDTVAEQIDVASVLASQPLPRGGRVMIVTNARGPAIACADACAAAGLDVSADPLDLGAEAGPDAYAGAIARLAETDVADALVAIFVPSLSARAEDVASALRATAAPGTPLLGVFMAQSDAELAALIGDLDVPMFRSPEEAGRALGRIARYSGRRALGRDVPPALENVDADAAAAVLAGALERGGGWLRAAEVDALLAAYGIPTVEARTAAAPSGVEMVAGVLTDPDFGPVVACGPGGPAVELLGDVAVGLAPLGRRTAHELVTSLRSLPLLQGYRGAPHADLDALEDVLLRLSALAAGHPEIAELDCDPLLASPAGAMVIDARARVTPPGVARPFPALDR